MTIYVPALLSSFKISMEELFDRDDFCLSDRIMS